MTPELRFDRLLDFFGEKKKKTGKAKKVKKEVKGEVKKASEKKKVILKKEEETKQKIKREEEKEKEFLVFKMGEEFYSLPLKKIKEIYKSLEIINAPQLPSYILGFAKFKKNIIPVIDISEVLKIQSSEKKNYIVIEAEKYPVFLVIGEIKGIVKESEENTFEVPFTLDRDLFQKIIYEDNTLIGCINPEYFSRVKEEIGGKGRKGAK